MRKVSVSTQSVQNKLISSKKVASTVLRHVEFLSSSCAIIVAGIFCYNDFHLALDLLLREHCRQGLDLIYI